ncbi:hypothetical protein EHI8A_012040 [Entamoeba histolytica HM-1:IMSS-B]|uniref:Uncharacterized protein n=6 Tax=Entamoeba histolytica TaxID=5759 RepID=C4M6G4_ENTH1|nr:hypothetical protein EHI_099840 [Entamoeba histolytica HM-1:IMSS]EMD49507.1 replication factor C subunit, putative [Entamoeba histolytica KU27]EMH75156.1 hypothetical protein EHI8A_012040 [Entamoeba histolytica HM-1:IMSS-B]EMS13742.1 replication factor C subunit, putative [Entamoeba histolytica HM-3:IMSS]ENY63019.1 replication factor C subunit, putative [Entamoeba histolytica HM-1:IMSS-A]GAT97083.1 hypothetical protein CL6EHI_099840 [Entamoeba histolytica]|eukprot:XP_651282.1 hypothetical protein EHI_099840 [Entamoeba histolytica HM-1:IMSS]
MAIVEKELQYIKKERFLQNKPSTMYSNPFRLQYFHNANEGPHGLTSIFLNYFFDTTIVHMAPLNPLGSFYYQLDALLEYHPHICIGEGYGALILYHFLTSHKYDGNSVLMYLPLSLVHSIHLPSKGKHILIFDLKEVNEENAIKLLPQEGEIKKEETDSSICLKKGNISIYLIKLNKQQFVNIEEAKTNKFTLKNVIETVCDEDLAFSRLQDKGMMIINAFLLTLFFIITYGLVGYSMKKQQINDSEQQKKEN